MSKQWYAVYTKPRAEKRVAELLAKKRLEAYCPLQNVKKGWNDRKKVEEPVFTSYVFVRVSEAQLTQIKQTEGVLNLVYWLDNPVVVSDIEIEMMRRFLAEHKKVQIERTGVAIGEMVKLISDPFFIEKEGDVLFVRNAVEKMVLPSLGYIIVANKINNIRGASLSALHLQIINMQSNNMNLWVPTTLMGP